MKQMKRLLTLALVVFMFLSMSTEAYAKVKLTPNKLILFRRKSTILEMLGTKSPVKWKVSKSTVEAVNEDGKVTAKEEEKTAITAKEEEKTTITATVDDKDYTREVTVEKESEHVHSHIYEVIKHPTCAETGEEKGVCDCGDEIIITISNEGMEHIYHLDVVVEATCTEGGVSYESCHLCGDMRRVEGSETSKLGHDYQKKIYPLGEPDCTAAGYYNVYCSRCGKFGGDGWDPALECDFEEEITYAGTCMPGDLGVKKLTCKNCGFNKTEYFTPNIEHTWATKISNNPVWSDEALDFVYPEITYCTVCGVNILDVEAAE